jgi:drug/metabolite transporter (DMT)-like permease
VELSILLLLVVAAFGNAVWNAISKRIHDRDTFFTLITGLAVVIYFPFSLYLFPKFSFSWEVFWYIVGSACFELIYLLSIARAYQQLPLSIAYPLIRGVGPFVATVLSFLLGVMITNWGALGILAVVIGILTMQWNGKLEWQTGIGWAFFAGASNGVAMTFDSLGAVIMPALLFKYFVFIGMVLGKIALDRHSLRVYLNAFRSYPSMALLGAVLIFGSNGLAQYALQSTPVGYVAATRELSIVFAAFIGWLCFREKIKSNQWVGIGFLLVGVFLIAMRG